MRPDHRRVFDTLVYTDDRVLADECEQSEAFLLSGEWLRSAGSRHLRCPADVTKRASESEAALLERASAPSRPDRRARREQRAGVASSERESCRPVRVCRAVELAARTKTADVTRSGRPLRRRGTDPTLRPWER